MENQDTRVQFTKNALKTALLDLLRKKPIAKVSVKELCQKAGLNRSTFYLHYGEPNDVLREIEEETIERLLPGFNRYSAKSNDLNLLSSLFTAMLKEKELFLILMGNNGAPQFTERIKKRMWLEVKDVWHREFPSYDMDKLKFVYDYVFAGSIQAQLEWIQDGKDITTEQIARRLDRLGHYCQLAIREF
ncbi:MAG: TetR/AcrR family transcriptional regulator [Lachnospiraceae bacterium]|nr:TetR/AcrR family transcriptional regulator [Lachnospiraceae bacterium]